MVAEGFQKFQSGYFAGAERCFRTILNATPDHPEALRLLGEVMLDRGQFSEAISLLERLAAYHPGNFLAHCTLGTAYRLAKQNAAAIASYRTALSLKPNFAGALHGLGVTLRGAECESEALEVLRQAVRLQPDWAVAWKDMGLTLAILGDLQLAEAALERAVSLQPGLGDAQRHLAALRHGEAGEGEMKRLTAACADPRTPAGEAVEMLFALGRMADKAGAFDDAFAHFSLANALVRNSQAKLGIGFDRARLTRDVDRLIAAFSKEVLSGSGGFGSPSEVPVFIVGMPRAGSTLFEQIAASHSQVFGAGERAYIGEIASKLGGIPNQSWTAQNIDEAARTYLEALQRPAPSARRIIDKMPDNIFQLGLIAALFPHARVIFCDRDARDIALSCFFQNFALPYGFDTDLNDCAFRIQQIDRLRVHWAAVLPIAHMTMSYEALVANPEGESRRLIEFLGLDWEPQCLEFHRNQRAVRTASMAQVRRPLYLESAGRWRNYKTHLPAALRQLGD